MSDLIKKIKIRKQDGTFTDYIPIGAEAQNINMQNNKNLQETIGVIDVDNDGNIAEQLEQLKQNIQEIIEILREEGIILEQ